MSATIAGQRETGTVRMFDAWRGFGIIEPTSATTPSVFVHATELRGGIEALVPGRTVQFILHRRRCGWCAGRVRLVNAGA